MYNKDINKKNAESAPAKESRARRTKVGTYSVIVTALVLAVIIVANVILYSLPQEYTIFDTTKTEWTEISAKTENFISVIDTPITIYAICENSDIDHQYNTLLQKYTEANENITVEIVDPLDNPNFVGKYTDATLTNGSLIVESEKRSTVIDYSTMTYYASPTYNGLVNSETDVKLSYSEYVQVYQKFAETYGYYITDFEQYFQAETLITSAIDYVTVSKIPQTYILDNESDKKFFGQPSETLTAFMTSSSLEVKSLVLSSDIPEDANCIVIFAPKADISDGQYAKLEAFVSRGGSICLITDPSCTKYANLMKLGALFGCAAEDGMVRDSDSAHNSDGNTSTLRPDISTSHKITYDLLASGNTVQFPNAHSIVISDKLPSGVKADPLFYTSSKGFRVSIEDDNTRLSENSVHNVGVAASKKINSDTTSYFMWLGSVDALTDDQASASYGGNYYYFIYGLRWMSEIFSSEYLSIPGTNISGDYLNGLTLGSVITWGIIIVAVIPLSVLTCGFVIWFRRRRR
ncbi:MAG: hypothetical protein E7589_02850 [Ruminococcaceae bacterium]|nr:hypothetical protein [Oscillospiraceae bacterium]